MRSIVNFILSRNRSFFGARCLVVFLLIGAMIIPIASNTGSAQSPDSGPKSKADELRERARAARLASLQADADKPHTLAASYYSLQGNLKATLMLNNKGPKPLDVQPTFFNLFGDRLDVPAVTVGANTFREIDLSEWAGLGGRMFNEGSLQLFYKGPDLLMGAQVRMVDPRFSLMFDEQLVEPAAKYSSSRLEGVWLLPSRYCQLRVVLTNTTDDPLSLSVTVDGAGAKQREAVTLTLRPRETRVMDGRQGLMEKQGGGLAEAGGISIHHSGAGGALIARGMISETAMGYSSAVEFLDPQQAKSSRLHGAGLRLGRAGGEQLTAEVVARNIGEAETVLRGRIPYTTSDGSAGEIAVNEVRLRPGEVRRLNLNRAANLPQREEIASAGLELEYDGKPGSVIVSALSASRSRDHVYEVPMLDPAAQQSSTGGYPWRIEGGSSTFVYIKNVSDKSQQYHLQLSCEVEGQEGEIGVYSPGLVTVEAGQTITLDIRRLRDEQVADEAGRLIPVEANRGQVMWSVRGGDSLSLIGRAEQADFAQAVSSTYACQNCCPDSFNDGWCDPFSVEGVVGSTEQFTANQQDRNCYGTILTSYVVFASWSSSNTSIATVDGGGLATAQGPGSTDIFANWYVSTFLSMEGFPQCIEDEELFFASSVCEVRVIEILVSPSSGIRPTGAGTGNTATITVQTFPPGQGIQVTLTAIPVSSSGGHVSHSGTRPTGSFAASQGTTGANGVFQTTYTAPIFGGTMIIRATLLNGQVNEFLLIWVESLFELGSGANYTLTGTTTTHPNNHFGTSSAVNNLPLIANDYKNQFYGAGTIPEGDKLRMNDISLINGGKFEIAGNWCSTCSHNEHRVGINCDLSSSNVPSNRHQALEAIFENRGSPNFLNEGNHWHLRFE